MKIPLILLTLIISSVSVNAIGDCPGIYTMVTEDDGFKHCCIDDNKDNICDENVVVTIENNQTKVLYNPANGGTMPRLPQQPPAPGPDYRNITTPSTTTSTTIESSTTTIQTTTTLETPTTTIQQTTSTQAIPSTIVKPVQTTTPTVRPTISNVKPMPPTTSTQKSVSEYIPSNSYQIVAIGLLILAIIAVVLYKLGSEDD